MRNIVRALLVMAALLAVAAAQSHPSFEGTWYMDKVHSQYPAESVTEVIQEHGEAIDITITEKRREQPTTPMQLHLTIDGKPTTSTVGPNKFTATTHWEEGKLVTFVEGERGQHMIETRQLSSDGKTLTVTGFHQDELKKPYYVRVMTRNNP